ncbi:MAG: exo-alpha-sialidase [Saprospiraceae bacterium]|nr:exo-alpha-sialidase [Saprospiraceae bacterium]
MIFRRLIFTVLISGLFACNQAPESVQSAEAGILTNEAQGAEKPSVDAGIVFQSLDGGNTWLDVSAGLPEKFRPEAVYVQNDEVLVSCESGLFRGVSRPNAAPGWQKSLNMNGAVFALYPGKKGPYAWVFERGYFQQISSLDIWQPVLMPLQHDRIYEICETNSGVIFAVGEKGIFKSPDEGITWKQVYTDGVVMSLMESNGVLVAGGVRGILRSTDGGEHWDTVLSEEGLAQIKCQSQGRILAITAGSKPNSKGMTEPNTPNRLHMSTDGGITWQRIDETLPPVEFVFDEEERNIYKPTIRDIKIVGDQLFCSHQTGLLKSSDWGKTWEIVIPTEKDWMFEFSVSGKSIYAIKVFAAGC